MSRWSNLFVSLGTLALVAACQSTPPSAIPPSAPEVAAQTAGGSQGGAGIAAGGASALGSAAAGSTGGAIPVPDRAAQQYADAVKLMKAGRGPDAEVQFKQLAAAYPQFAGPEINLGLLYLQASRLPEAETAFKAAVERNPGSASAGNELGIVERRLGKFAEAEAAYQRTIVAAPEFAPAYLNLGVLYDLYLAEPRKALEQFEHYVQLAGDSKQVTGWIVELRKRVGAPAKKEPA